MSIIDFIIQPSAPASEAASVATPRSYPTISRDCRHVDDSMVLLDRLFERAEGLLGAPKRRILNEDEQVLLDSIIGDIDAVLLDMEETLSEPALPPAANIFETPHIRLSAFQSEDGDIPDAPEPREAIQILAQTADLNVPCHVGPLTLDHETALDRITAQLDLGSAMDLPPSEILCPSPTPRLTVEEAERVEALMACMDHILSHHTRDDGLLSQDAHADLLRLMAEADQLVGYQNAGLSEILAPAQTDEEVHAENTARILRRSLDALGDAVSDAVSDAMNGAIGKPASAPIPRTITQVAS